MMSLDMGNMEGNMTSDLFVALSEDIFLLAFKFRPFEHSNFQYLMETQVTVVT